MGDFEFTITGIILLVIMIIIFIAAMFNMSINESVAPVTNDVTTPCNHEFIVTSEYDWWWRSYRTFSKCVKCGLEM